MGLDYDFDIKSLNKIYTHSRALSVHKNFNLLAGIDKSNKQRTKFKKKYNLPAFKDISSLNIKDSIELAIIATPPENHYENILSLIRIKKPKIILCEKPLSDEAINAKKIIELCKKNSIKLFINYIRRADPGILEVKKLIHSGNLKMPFKGIVWFTKGVKNNGSHFLDLTNFFFGESECIKKISPIIGDKLFSNDFDTDFIVNYKGGSIIFRCLDHRYYNHYSFDLYFSNASINYKTNGLIKINQIVEKKLPMLNKNFLTDESLSLQNVSSKYQYHVLSELLKEFKEKNSYLCTGSEALTLQNQIMSLEKES